MTIKIVVEKDSEWFTSTDGAVMVKYGAGKWCRSGARNRVPRFLAPDLQYFVKFDVS
jgi:hypothetical protein